jgi:hypothetical protein
MKGLAAQIETQGPPNESLHPLPDPTGLPLPTGFPTNANWYSFTFESATQRPEVTISWSSSMPKVEKCWSDIVRWGKFSADWWNHNYAGRTVAGPATMSTTLRTYNTTMTTTSYPLSVNVYTLCNGSPRVDASPMTGTTVSMISTDIRSYTRVANWTRPVPIWQEPQPCEVSPEM